MISTSLGLLPTCPSSTTTDDVQTNTWDLKSAEEAFPGIDFLSFARIEVSAEEDTITLSGEIPGITADSRLAFGVYDYLGGEEEIGCLTSFCFGRLGRHSPSDGSGAVSDPRALDDVSHELVGHIDIRDVTTEVDGDTLTVDFLLRDVPEMLTFDRTGVPAHALKYSWEVSIDVDDDRATGLLGAEYSLSASHFVFSPSNDGGTHQSIEEAVQADSWEMDADGTGTRLDSIGIAVSSEEDTITLVGDVPGITPESRLVFKAYDFRNRDEQAACQVLSSLDGSE